MDVPWLERPDLHKVEIKAPEKWKGLTKVATDISGLSVNRTHGGFGKPGEFVLDVDENDFEHLLHELGHWLFATTEEKEQPNIGLLDGKMSKELLYEREYAAVWFSIKAIMMAFDLEFGPARKLLHTLSEYGILMDCPSDKEPEPTPAEVGEALALLATPLRKLLESALGQT